MFSHVGEPRETAPLKNLRFLTAAENSSSRGFKARRAHRFFDTKGHVPTMLLFAVALALFVALLFAFVSFGGTFESQSQTFLDVMSDAAFQQAYIVLTVERAGSTSIVSGSISQEGFERAVAEREIRMEGVGNFFAKVRNGEFRFERRDGTIVLEVRGLFVQAQRGETQLLRRFDIIIEFDSSGNVMQRKVCEQGRC